MFSIILKFVVFIVLGFLLPIPLYCYEYKRHIKDISKRGKIIFWIPYSIVLLLPVLLIYVWAKGLEPIILFFILVLPSIYYIMSDSFKIEYQDNVKRNIKNLRLWIQPIVYITLITITILTSSYLLANVQKSVAQYSFATGISIEKKENNTFNIYYDISESRYRVFIVKDGKIKEVFPNMDNYNYKDTVNLKETTISEKITKKTIFSESKETIKNDITYELIIT